MRVVFFALLIWVLTGCTALSKQEEKDLALWLVPVNATVGYFGAVALHEGGHAITAEALGGDDTRVYVLPRKDREGHFHLGLTTTRFDDPSDLEVTLFRTMGPTAQWLGHISSRLLLRSGSLPRLTQPTVAWFGFANQLGYYAHTIFGLARLEGKDLGEEEAWISAVMLTGALTIDVIDFLTDEPDRYFGVLFGQRFYGEDDKRFGFTAAPLQEGGYFGFWARF